MDDRTALIVVLKAVGALAYRLTGEQMSVTIRSETGELHTLMVDDTGVQWSTPGEPESLHAAQPEYGDTPA